MKMKNIYFSPCALSRFRAFALSFLLFILCVSLPAQPPAGYYNLAANKSGAALYQALHQIIKVHTELKYTPDIWNAFYTTDVKSDGTIFDIYTASAYLPGANQCGQSPVGCYNREHTIPQSWFYSQKPMRTDLFHVYPADGQENSRRNNYPYAEVADPPRNVSSNGSRYGECSTAGYTGRVFEPTDSLKGDLARTYFYMSVCYKDRRLDSTTYGNAVFDSARLTPWALDMFIRWHNADPVSEKELNRNNAVYELQRNRNPFIDYPELASLLWGADTINSFRPAGSSIAAVKPITAKVYPNPASTTLTIELSQSVKGQIILYNSSGQTVRTEPLVGDRKTLNISNLSAGIYAYKLVVPNKQLTGKFTVARLKK
jgi:endonuclease I